MLATDPYNNGCGLRIPRGEIFSSVINHPGRVSSDGYQMKIKDSVSILKWKPQN
jgi:hypothetical protein